MGASGDSDGPDDRDGDGEGDGGERVGGNPGVWPGAEADGLPTATWLAAGATGSWSPPRAATNVTAIAAHASAKIADASTAGVNVRREALPDEPPTPLPHEPPRIGAAAGC